MPLMQTPDPPLAATDRALVVRLESVAEAARALNDSSSIAELFSRAGDAVCEHLGFARCLVFALVDGQLDAGAAGAYANPRSDRLRRVALSTAIPLRRGTPEFLAARIGGGAEPTRANEDSVIGDALGVHGLLIAPVVADTRTIAIVACDRDDGDVDDVDIASLRLMTGFIAGEAARIVQGLRVEALLEEVRHSSASLVALAREAREAPVELPRDHGLGIAFPRAGVPAVADRDQELARTFTAGELKVARLLVEGRSNREIAEALTLSPETIKTYVARILRKLGANNRAEAVYRFLRMAGVE